MHVYLGADHRGFNLKKSILDWLSSHNLAFTDFGANTYCAEDDYNDYARPVAHAIAKAYQAEDYLHDLDILGILVCSSGQGMAMQANRLPHVRAALCLTPSDAIEARRHNHANILCLSADNLAPGAYGSVLEAFFNTSPLNAQKYQRRNQKLDQKEDYGA